MDGPASDRQALEKPWRARVEAAWEQLQSARAHLKRVEEERRSGLFPFADGDFAYREALRAETHALIAYSRVLRILTDLVAHGKIPNGRNLE